MSRRKTEIGEIRYNPIEECFEALVTFHGTTGTRRIAASIRAPLTAEFDVISRGLWQMAQSQINKPDQIRSRIEAAPKVPARPLPSGFDWQALLHAPRAA